LQNSGLLGATFFCSQSAAAYDVHRIFPTLSFQLAQRFPQFGHAIAEVISLNPEVIDRFLLERQFSDLIQSPIQRARDFLLCHPVIIVIDALDECQDQNQVKDFLTILFRRAQNLPIKFFITSRPEPRVREAFRISPVTLQERLCLHDVEKELVDADIELYLRKRLGTLEGRSEYSPEWPTDEAMKTLVCRCDKLFIYAATACHYIEAGPDANARLSQLVSISSTPGMYALDTLYGAILNAAYLPL